MRYFAIPFFLLAISGCTWAQPEARIVDLKHYSKVFGEERNFRVFLPPDYDAAISKRYPVVYFFHGWSERYNKPPRGNQGYDSGNVYGGDTIARFVGSHDLIVVKWDGYNPRTPGEDYPRPYNISPVETDRQFPLYFPELVAHIDATFRTIPDREHRATAGLSMGGFMSYWVAGKYPHLVGSASNFMGSSEFYVGPKAFATEYRHTQMYRNYEGMRTRLVTGSRDFIRWYHGRMNAVWSVVRPQHETQQFDHDHGTPGMARTLDFHMSAFRDPLPRPALWHHAEVYPEFDVWGYSVQTNRRTPGYSNLENVSKSGFRSSVREWLPSGRLLPEVVVQIATDALYKPKTEYRITDVNVTTGEVKQVVSTSDEHGRLHLEANGQLHEFGIADLAAPVLTVTGWRIVGASWATNGAVVKLRLNVLNKGAVAAGRVQGILTSRTPGVHVPSGTFKLARLKGGEALETADIAVDIGSGEREIVQLLATVNGVSVPLELPVFDKLPLTPVPIVLDGSKATVWQRAIRPVDLSLGAGNADGRSQPGESVVLAVQDGTALRAVEVLTSDPCLDTSERVSDEWGAYDNVGATSKYTILRISPACEVGRKIPLMVEYQLPHKPDHILKQAAFLLEISAGRRSSPE